MQFGSTAAHVKLVDAIKKLSHPSALILGNGYQTRDFYSFRNKYRMCGTCLTSLDYRMGLCENHGQI